MVDEEGSPGNRYPQPFGQFLEIFFIMNSQNLLIFGNNQVKMRLQSGLVPGYQKGFLISRQKELAAFLSAIPDQ